MILLNQVLKKLHTKSLVVPNWVVFFKTRPFVKQNNVEFTTACSFTALLRCNTPLYCLAGYFFLPFPPATILSSLCMLKSTESLLDGLLFRPLWCWLLLWPMQFIRTGVNWILDFRYARPCYLMQEVFVLHSFVCI